MSRQALHQAALDPGAMEEEMRQRLRHEQAKLFISQAILFLLAVAFIMAI